MADEDAGERLARFFREERPDLGFEGDVEGWDPVESAMAFLRRQPGAAKPIFAYGATLQRSEHTGAQVRVVNRLSIGWTEAADEDTARGIALRKVMEDNGGMAVLDLLVMEVARG